MSVQYIGLYASNRWHFALLADRTAHSMIGYWHHHIVRPSVRLSVSLSITLCIVALTVGIGYWAKSCTSVLLAGKFLFVLSETFAAVYNYIVYSHKTHRKNESKKTRTWVFWDI